MHVTLRQLKVFEAVARQLSFTRAASELHLSQPAVSMQIKQLEDNVGLPLFEQLGKKVYLTEAGRELYRYSRTIERELREMDEVFAQLKGVTRGRLSVSVASTANYFAPRLLAAFFRRHRNISYSLDVTNRGTLLRQLEENERDLVIMGKPPEDLDLTSEAFMVNPLVVIAAPDHPLARERDIAVARLQQETFVVREPVSGTRMAMARFFAEHGLSPAIGMETTRNEAIKQAVAAGLGVAIVSIHTLDLELRAGVLAILHVQGLPILRHWYVVHRQGKRLSPIAQAFKDFVLAEAGRLWPAGQALGGYKV